LPLAFVFLLVVGHFAFFWSPMLRTILVLSLALYGGMILASSAALAFSQGWPNFFLAPVIYPTVHFGLGVGMLAEWLDVEKKLLRFEQSPLVQQDSVAEAPVTQNSSK